MRIHSVPLMLLMAAGAFLAASAAPAVAQGRCAEFRTFSGACVAPRLATAARKRSIFYSQSKVSDTAPPLLPAEERGYLAWKDLHEIHNLYTFPPLVTAPNNFPRP
jgi:hypothetical protein